MINVQRSSHEISHDGTQRQLTPTEYQLIEAIGILGKGQLITRETLIQGTWGHRQIIPDDHNNLLILISRLRKKVGINFIRTRRGYGYYLTEEIRFMD